MENEKEVAIELKYVNKTFSIQEHKMDSLKTKLFNLFGSNSTKKFHALKKINLEIYKGETIGLIGRNGSGKSTLTKIMAGTYIPDKGGIVNRFGSMMLMNLGVGMSHELTARQNIYISGSVLGLKKKQIHGLVDKILAFAQLEEFADTKIKHFSTGMIQRLSFSIAVNAGADIIFLDEVFAVGDQKFREKAVQVFEKNWIQNKTSILVSHSLQNIRKYCNRTIYLKKGEVAFFGETEEALRLYHEDLAED